MYRMILLSLMAIFFGHAYAENTNKEDPRVTQARTEAELEKSVKRLNEKCGGETMVSVEWETFSKEDVEKYSIQSFCESPIDALGSLCFGEQTKQYVKNNVKTIACTYGGKDKGGLKVNGKTISFLVDFELPNQGDMAYKALMRNL